MAKLSFLLGAATGYVLGARAGRERYDQISSSAQRLWRSEPVQGQVSTAKHAAKTKAAPAARDAVSTAASATGDKLRSGAGKVTSGKGDEASVDATADQGPATYPLGESPGQSG